MLTPMCIYERTIICSKLLLVHIANVAQQDNNGTMKCIHKYHQGWVQKLYSQTFKYTIIWHSVARSCFRPNVGGFFVVSRHR
mmetsp:Transcript_50837/g.108312  ORF Transcript_50837/g.108312 Transcript_50837/m.108312 type:complete len:82 (-) Transcript_50837:672-917(-)